MWGQQDVISVSSFVDLIDFSVGIWNQAPWLSLPHVLAKEALEVLQVRVLLMQMKCLRKRKQIVHKQPL